MVRFPVAIECRGIVLSAPCISSLQLSTSVDKVDQSRYRFITIYPFIRHSAIDSYLFFSSVPDIIKYLKQWYVLIHIVKQNICDYDDQSDNTMMLSFAFCNIHSTFFSSTIFHLWPFLKYKIYVIMMIRVIKLLLSFAFSNTHSTFFSFTIFHL